MPKRDTTVGSYPLLLSPFGGACVSLSAASLVMKISSLQVSGNSCELFLQVLRELRIVKKLNRGKLQHSHGLWDSVNEYFLFLQDIFQAFEPTDSCKLRRSECNKFSQYHLNYISH